MAWCQVGALCKTHARIASDVFIGPIYKYIYIYIYMYMYIYIYVYVYVYIYIYIYIYIYTYHIYVYCKRRNFHIVHIFA